METDNTDKQGRARTGTDLEPAGGDPWRRAEAALQTLGACPHCGGTDLDLDDDYYYEADGTEGLRWHAYCYNCGLTTPLVETPEEAAAWWRRLVRALAAQDCRDMLAADEEAPAFGGDVAEMVTVSMTRDQAQALWGLAGQLIEGMEPHAVGGRTLWTAQVGRTRVTVEDRDLDQAARGMCAIREALNAAHREAGDALGQVLALADRVSAKAEG